MAAQERAEALPPRNVRRLAELLAVQPRLYAGAGRVTMELRFEDGRLVEAFLHDRIPGGDLGLLEVVIPPEWMVAFSGG